jgi:hypothetical protein
MKEDTMRSTKPAIPVLLLALVLAQALTLAAQDKDADKAFTGSFSFGYRAVDQSGAADMYRQDVNLDNGVRLFNFDLSYAPAGDVKALFDRLDIHALNLGGDPYESFGLSVRKFGAYSFRYEHRKSTYFYANGDQTQPGVLFDPARFNFDRVSDTGALTVTLSKILNVFVNFDRYTKSGDSASSFDVTSAVLDTDLPVSEKMTAMGFGLDLHVERLGLVFEQKHQDYQNTNSFFLSGPFNFTSDISTFRLNARPFDGLILRGSAQLSKLDSAVTTLDGGGAGAIVTGQGAFTRKIELYDFDLTWMLTNRLAVVGEVRYDTFGQNGLMTNADGTAAPDFGFKTFGAEGGLQIQLFPRFTLTGGFRYEKRTFTNAGGDVQISESEETESAVEPLETVTYNNSTVRKGLYGNLRWDLKDFKLTLDYQHGSYDDPYTLMSPTSTDRFRATLRYQTQGFSVAASFLSARTTNEIPGGVNFRVIYTDDSYSDLWKASNDQFSLRLGYNTTAFDASVGYTLINFTTDSTRLVAYNPYWTGPAGTFPWVISYQGKSTLLDASVRLNLDASWKIGATAFSYQNSGFWPLEQLNLRAFVEYTFMGGFVSQLAYRYYDFKETDTELIIRNNYSAGILEISFGYRWR